VYPYFTLSFSEDMLAATVSAAANYELLGSGGDGTFADGNEELYTVAVGSYASGLSNSYSIPDGPLQPDTYRFRVKTGLRDKLNNPLAAEHVRSWSVQAVPGYVFESRSNESFATADSVSVNVMPGEFDGSFLDAGLVRGSVGNNPYDVEAADLDGDGHLDLAVAYLGSDGLRLFPGAGDGTFGAPQEFVLPADTYDVELFDLDNDGDLDAAVVVSGQDRVDLFRNESTAGSISFAAAGSVAVGDDPRRVRSGRINGDGFADLVVSTHGTNAAAGRSVSVLLSDQAGGFTEAKLGLELSPRVGVV
jgi:hypothetical protein